MARAILKARLKIDHHLQRLFGEPQNFDRHFC